MRNIFTIVGMIVIIILIIILLTNPSFKDDKQIEKVKEEISKNEKILTWVNFISVFLFIIICVCVFIYTGRQNLTTRYDVIMTSSQNRAINICSLIEIVFVMINVILTFVLKSKKKLKHIIYIILVYGIINFLLDSLKTFR